MKHSILNDSTITWNDDNNCGFSAWRVGCFSPVFYESFTRLYYLGAKSVQRFCVDAWCCVVNMATYLAEGTTCVDMKKKFISGMRLLMRFLADGMYEGTVGVFVL
jgi:hypothetical protein